VNEHPIFSVVIPCFNEQEALPHTITVLIPALDSLTGGSWEIVLVDDGSTDATATTIRTLHDREDRVKGVMLTRNFGHQAALWAGLEAARGDFVGIIDSDLQDPIDVLAQLLEEVRSGRVEICYGVRRNRDAPFLLNLSYNIFYRLIAAVSENDWPVDAGDFCVMSRKAVNILLSLPETVRMMRGLRAWIGMKSSGVAYDRPARIHGRSKYNLARLVRLAGDSFIGFSVVPLRIASVTGVCIAFLTLLFGLFIVLNRLIPSLTFLGYDLGKNPGLASVLFLVSFVSSLTLFCLGVIGEYISVLLKEVKARPQYIVGEKI
jgi:dolichol-phosphate mannosyltransferase